MISGILESQAFENKNDTSWKTLSWNGTKPPGTDIKFQLRTGISQPELLSKPYTGPDGLSDTYYKVPDDKIWFGHERDRIIQTKIYFSTFEKTVRYNIYLIFNEKAR